LGVGSASAQAASSTTSRGLSRTSGQNDERPRPRAPPHRHPRRHSASLMRILRKASDGVPILLSNRHVPPQNAAEMDDVDASEELVEFYLGLAADSAGRIVPAEPSDGGAAIPVPGPRFWAPHRRIVAPRVRYLPSPRLPRYRPLVGRSPRGRRARSSRTSRGSPARQDDDPPQELDVARSLGVAA
jgi:hypothetical protein